MAAVMPAKAKMNNAMQHFKGTDYIASDQHKDTGQMRTARDDHDAKQILTFFHKHSPFDETDKYLQNIETGVTMDDKVNAHKRNQRNNTEKYHPQIFR